MNDLEKQENDIIDDENSLNQFLSTCEQCGEEAWDGYICHNCGLKRFNMREKLKQLDNFQYKLSQNGYFTAFALFGLLAADKVFRIPYVGLPLTLIISLSVVMALTNGCREINKRSK